MAEIKTGTGTPVRNVNTGAKDIPDLTAAIEKLAEKSKQESVNKLPGKQIGQFRIFMGVDASETLYLVQGKSGSLSLWTGDFGIHPEGGHIGWGTTYKKVGNLGDALTTDRKFDQRAKAFAPFGADKPEGTLKKTGYEIALSGGDLFVEKPNVNGRHTLLSVLAPKSSAE